MRIHLTSFTFVPLMKAHPYSLLSFYYRTNEKAYMEVWNDPRHRSVILDSGAFSAWSLGKSIDRSQYLDWILSIQEKLKDRNVEIYAINLDFIPGKKGITATSQEINDAILQSKINASFFRSQGVYVAEVFHQDEPISLFFEIADRADRRLMCLSPRNDVSIKKRGEWLRWLTGQWIKKRGTESFPRCHGLAVTSFPLLMSFPFFSVDSSSVMACLKYGTGRVLGRKKIPKWSSGPQELEIAQATLRAEIRKYQEMERRATMAWASRGIVWDH